MKGLETNVLVRVLSNDDPVQADLARQLLVSLRERGEAIYVSLLNLVEVVWVLQGARYRWRRGQIVEVLEQLLETEALVLEDRDAVALATQDYRRGGADFADYLIGHRNRRAGCSETVTFDRALAQTPGFTVLSAATGA